MHSLSESESATKRGNASAIVNLRFVAIITSKFQNSAIKKEVNDDC